MRNKLTREQSSILTQLRTGHVPLNAYLFKIGKSNERHCKACRGHHNEDRPAETVNHYIFECTAYVNQRRDLEKSVGRDDMNLKSITKDLKKTKALLTYINRTKRFRENS